MKHGIRTKKGVVRTSLNLHENYLKAIQIVKDHERIYKSEQVELGLEQYLRQHEKLLAEHGIDLWINQ